MNKEHSQDGQSTGDVVAQHALSRHNDRRLRQRRLAVTVIEQVQADFERTPCICFVSRFAVRRRPLLYRRLKMYVVVARTSLSGLFAAGQRPGGVSDRIRPARLRRDRAVIIDADALQYSGRIWRDQYGPLTKCTFVEYRLYRSSRFSRTLSERLACGSCRDQKLCL